MPNEHENKDLSFEEEYKQIRYDDYIFKRIVIGSNYDSSNNVNGSLKNLTDEHILFNLFPLSQSNPISNLKSLKDGKLEDGLVLYVDNEIILNNIEKNIDKKNDDEEEVRNKKAIIDRTYYIFSNNLPNHTFKFDIKLKDEYYNPINYF